MRRAIGVLFLLLAGFIGLPVRAQPVEQRLAPPVAHSLIAADPVADTSAGMQAWRIRYRTTSEEGAPLEVTGMVVAPREALPRQPRPVIAWTHGTWGVVEKCGPSLSPDFYTATPGLAEMVRRGYVVAAPDYPGLGSPGTHAFLVGKETARSVLDAVRAAQAISGAGAGSRFAVWGESQGGHAALWTASEAARYAPDLTLVGTAAAAPPTDLVANLRQAAEPNAGALMTAFLAYSWSQKFQAPLSSVFNRVNQGVVTRLAQNNCISLGGTPSLGMVLGVTSVREALKRKDIGAIRPWSSLARANSVVPARVAGPLLVAQSDGDKLVAPAVTRQFARAYCRLGRPLRFVALSGVGHERSARDSAKETLDWIDARFARRPLPNDCRSL